jgi:hypothetical protein
VTSMSEEMMRRPQTCWRSALVSVGHWNLKRLDVPVTTGPEVFSSTLICWRGMLGSRHLVVSRRTDAA